MHPRHRRAALGALVALAIALEPWPASAHPPTRAEAQLAGPERLADIVSGRAARRRQQAPPATAEAATASPTGARLEEFLPSGRKRQARSVGKPNRGRLDGGVALPRQGPGFKRLDRDRHFGTDETIGLLRYLGARLLEVYPGTEPMLVGDISQEGGGRVRPHRSHQSGRDVDIAFFEKGNPVRRHYKGDLQVDDIDLDKSWFLIETLLLTGRVEYIFVNRSVQPALRRHARSVGWSDEALDRIFETPPHRQAYIRHAAGHTYHFHVRIKCGEGDRRCQSY